MIRSTAFALALLASVPAVAQTEPKPLPRAMFIANAEAEFNKVDTNKDGQMSKLEIETFQRSTSIAVAEARSKAVFAALDVDKNGQLSAVEFAKLTTKPPAVDAARVLKMDSNKDGKLSLAEHRSNALANFDRLDANKDGSVTVAELKASQTR